MKNKSVIILSLILVSTFAMPTMVAGYDTGVKSSDFHLDDTELNQDEIGSVITNVFDGFDSVFGQGYGASGQILGEMFRMLFGEVYENLTKQQLMPGVWVFSAETDEENVIQDKGIARKSTHFLPDNYYQNISVTQDNRLVYCNVSTTGTADIDYERGGGVTFIIWDNDGSFVSRLTRLFDFIKKIRSNDGLTRNQIISGINMVVDFLFNLNDIFTGDELFVLNPITWQRMTIIPKFGGITVERNWYITGPDKNVNSSNSVLNNSVPGAISDLQNAAIENNDLYMQYLANETNLTINEPQTWTDFTFDLLQLWIKNFHINIDLSALEGLVGNLGGGTGTTSPPSLGELFRDLDIQINLFTHHLGGMFLYNDTNNDNGLTVEYTTVNDTDGNPLRTENNRTIQIPKSSEVSNRLYLRNASDFNYLSPEVGENGECVEWGVNVTNVNVSAIPVGVGIDSYSQAESYELNNIYLGFNFTNDIRPDGLVEAPVKLDQHFGEWDHTSGLKDLDLAVIYVSTATYFHLQAEVNPVEDNYLESKEKDFRNGDSNISIGNYVYGGDRDLEFVDIAGPGYEIGGTGTLHPANTSIIPLGLWSAEMDRRDTFNTSTTAAGASTEAYVSDISAELDFQVMAYAVCYPLFNGSGEAIVHDPTFNVFMVFPGGPTFEAVILLSALIAPFGIAAVIITLLKRRRII